MSVSTVHVISPRVAFDRELEKAEVSLRAFQSRFKIIGKLSAIQAAAASQEIEALIKSAADLKTSLFDPKFALVDALPARTISAPTVAPRQVSATAPVAPVKSALSANEIADFILAAADAANFER